jgi:hypothetical protein
MRLFGGSGRASQFMGSRRHADRYGMNKVIAVLATGLTALALSWIPVAHAHAATAPTLQIVTGAAALPGMACPTSTICYAVGVNSGSTGVLVPVADTAQVVPGTDGLENIACSDASTCIAVGLSTGPSATAVIVPVDDGVAGAPEPVIGADLGLFDVACPTVTTCIAVGSNASSQGVVVPITNGAPGTAQIVANTSSLTSLGCPSATECEAAGADNASPAGDVVPIVDGTAGTAVPVPGHDFGRRHHALRLRPAQLGSPAAQTVLVSGARAPDGQGVVRQPAHESQRHLDPLPAHRLHRLVAKGAG